jgi:hypothetical protein
MIGGRGPRVTDVEYWEARAEERKRELPQKDSRTSTPRKPCSVSLKHMTISL